MRPDPAKALQQFHRLALLAAAWRSDYGHHEGGVLERVVEDYLGRRRAIHAECVRMEIADECDEGEMLSEMLLARIPAANRLSAVGQRLEDFHRRKPNIEWSAEYELLKAEHDLMRALDLALPRLGTPDFDGVLRAWEGLDATRVYHYGPDEDLAGTMSAVLPVADAYLALAAGIESVDRYARFEPTAAPAPAPAPAPRC